jgi:GNAT superfamily N-acetyltransferase
VTEVVEIRKASWRDGDADRIHACASEELNVGGVSGDFPSAVEIDDALRDDQLWLIATYYGHSRVVGFIHAASDVDRGVSANSACIVYARVIEPHQNTGVGSALLQAALAALKEIGIDYVYAWAHPTSGAVEFMEKHGFSRGKSCVWMDRKL